MPFGHGVDHGFDHHPWIVGWLATAFPVVIIGNRKAGSIHHLANEMNRMVVR